MIWKLWIYIWNQQLREGLIDGCPSHLRKWALIVLIGDGLTRGVEGQLGEWSLLDVGIEIVVQVTVLRVRQDHLLVLVSQGREDITHRKAIREVRALHSEPLLIVLHDGAVANEVVVHSNHALVVIGNLGDLHSLLNVLKVKGVTEDLGEGHLGFLDCTWKDTWKAVCLGIAGTIFIEKVRFSIFLSAAAKN